MNFYFIDEEYIKFLKRYEKEKRGITKVPNIRYSDRNKFAFGAVMHINGFHYYVSVSSFDDKKYRLLLYKEYKFCLNNSEKIHEKAKKIYEMVCANRKQKLTENSCDFHILEDGCMEYIKKYSR